MERFNIRAADLSDLPNIMLIQNQAYLPELQEERSVFESRMKVAPDFCFVVGLGGLMAGYVIAHPWPDRKTPGLGRIIDSIPEGADVIHLHDLAVSPSFRGRGIARLLLERLKETAQGGVEALTLVAVQGASTFWSHLGFEDDGPAEGYDPGARLMRCSLD